MTTRESGIITIERAPATSGVRQVSSSDLPYVEAHDRRILIVDDDESVRKLFADYLDESYSCATAADAYDALERLSQEPFALVLSDMQMPGLGGIELLRKIIERYPDTAVIMISGVDRTQRVIDAIRVGASDYLIKPCELDVLALCVERTLVRRTLLRNARRYKEALENQNAELARRGTELDRLQAQIVHTEKMASLGQLAAGVTHELNNPAGFIYSNIALLKDYIKRLERYLTAFDEVALPPAEAEGEVRIRTQCEGENVIVSVSDTGAGIEPEHLKNIFNPFFTTKPVGEGTGLGLSISHGVIVRHGGTVVVASTPARGTTFTITIPVDAKPISTNVSEACA